ncbi:RING-CH-type domain-containing protein [Aphelenchoides besseyi]|nr:RING-CH-type domain-containing protein [Aphelenchoides besseyi]
MSETDDQFGSQAEEPRGGNGDQMSDDDLNLDEDICRVCRLPEGVLYHPCLCTGSIKFVHQECLLQWLKYSKKDTCELCNHKFSFQPVYSKDMPERLPMYDLVKGVFLMSVRLLRYILIYMLVAVCWLAIVPVISCRINRMVFSGMTNSFLSFKILGLFSTDNLLPDISKGLFIASLFICAFIALVWLREQVNVGGPADMFNLPAAQNDEASDVPPVIPMQAFEPANNEPADAQANQEDNAIALLAVEAAAAERNNDNWGNVDRMGEDMTWQRLVGLDGSFVFIENAFWVISLNFLFNVIFLYWPSIAGTAILELFELQESVTHFETAISILIGYAAVIQVVYVFHLFAKLVQWQSLYRNSAVIYLMIKVFLLVFTELLFFPIICGWWLDICSLKLTNSSLDSRLKSFHSFPVTSIVLHWLAGMLYVFYSASFILALRALLRPGVLWFIRNLNDPEFNPVQEMITQPFPKHCRRLIASTSLFLSIIFLVVYCPLRIVERIPNIVPYTLTATEASMGGTWTLELLLFQVVLPTTLEHMKAYAIFEYFVKRWCLVVGSLLKLDSYLLSQRDRDLMRENDNPPAPEQDERPQEQEANPQVEGERMIRPRPPVDDLAARHHALLQLHAPADVEQYDRPDHFHWRLTALVLSLALSLVTLSTLALVVPVTIGRLLIAYGLGMPGAVHDIYTVGIGFCVCWLIGKTWLITRDWIQRGWDYVSVAVKKAFVLLSKILLAGIPTLFVIPLLLSIYFQLLIVGPIRVSIGQTPIFFPAKELAMGILHWKIICATIMMGPDWWFKATLEQIYADGVCGFRLKMLYFDVILPVVNLLSILIVSPYAIMRTALMFSDLDKEDQVVMIRMSYPSVLVFVLVVCYLKWQWAKLCAIAQKIRNDKYLIVFFFTCQIRDLSRSVLLKWVPN